MSATINLGNQSFGTLFYSVLRWKIQLMSLAFSKENKTKLFSLLNWNVFFICEMLNNCHSKENWKLEVFFV